MSVHDFDERLSFSHGQSDRDWWEIVYRRAFPDMVSMVDLRKDGWHQRAGRDRAIVLSSGRTIYVDEKVRGERYSDILIEIWSVYPKGGREPYPPLGRDEKEGWGRKPLDCDWLAYAFVPTATCHLLPFLGVRSAYEKHQAAWRIAARDRSDGFRWVSAENRSYQTVSIAVPIATLYAAVNDAMTVKWDQEAA